ncbi:alkaline phosphatase [Echinimonas agarilytica]|uniref:Alkaline phosphatase n=1 Tax=Echinimonas agarilytica TaxID=1215918 RepID=A0AA41W6W6_9GAMM|nr:alkaline phosphatase [Echinimonas agarilytica]MCM2680097.1 alkaline phosphatase [Echinimonas agarilytica]
MNNFSTTLIACSLTLFLGACSATAPASLDASPQGQLANQWFADGEASIALGTQKTINNKKGAAKNVILFVGDGMGISTITAARILAGQQQGQTGEEYQLSFEQLPFSGLVKTYNTNQQTPDSAGTMTAMMSGVKTKAGFIGVSQASRRADCQDYLNNGEALFSALELAELAGKSTGIVSTARLTHATPAATYAKSVERDWESDGDLKNGEAQLGCKDIASQLIDFKPNLEQRINDGNPLPIVSGIDVAFGGGRRAFFGDDPASIAGFSEKAGEGRRKDGRNLIEEWQQQGGQYVMDQAGFDALSINNDAPVLGLFNASHMRYSANRLEDKSGEPTLTEMTDTAIDLLQRNNEGFFLMVEAGRIDHGHHAGNAYNALTDAVELSSAVQKALEKTNPEETLIIVTADHSHVFTMAGYPTRGNPILGKVVGNDDHGEPKSEPTKADDGMPYTTLGYATGRGHASLENNTNADVRYGKPIDAGRHDISDIDTTHSGYHQEALVPLGSETHGGEDVAVYASGPGSHLVSGTIEQNVIFHVMNHAADLTGKASKNIQ